MVFSCDFFVFAFLRVNLADYILNFVPKLWFVDEQVFFPIHVRILGGNSH